MSFGEAVGVVAAQGVGQPATQMTLDTFHSAGLDIYRGAAGVSRLKELLDCSRFINRSSVLLLKRTDWSERFTYMRAALQLQSCMLSDFAISLLFIFDSYKVLTSSCADIFVGRLYVLELEVGKEGLNSGGVIRVELDVEKCDVMSITSRDVANSLECVISCYGICEVMFSPWCSPVQLVRIRISTGHIKGRGGAVDWFRCLFSNLLFVVIKGFDTIHHVSICEARRLVGREDLCLSLHLF